MRDVSGKGIGVCDSRHLLRANARPGESSSIGYPGMTPPKLTVTAPSELDAELKLSGTLQVCWIPNCVRSLAAIEFF